MTTPDQHTASAQVLERLKTQFSFQISVDVDRLPLGLTVAEAALTAGVTLVEMGTPLLKCEGVYNVVPAFRSRFPDALLLADMKTMDGGSFEARAVFEGGGNIIDFLAIAGDATARGICATRDEYRRADPTLPRLVFADILIPHQGPGDKAVETALRMLDAGVDGIGVHLQLDARRADPSLFHSSYLADVVRAVHDRVGKLASVQVVGGLYLEQAVALAKAGLRAFVISGNLGLPDAVGRYAIPPEEIQQHIADFIAAVSKA